MEEVEEFLLLIERYLSENENIPPELLNEFQSFIEEANEFSQLLQEVKTLQEGEAAVQEEAPITPVSPFAVPQTEELLWILSGGSPENFVSYIQSFPDEDLRPLLRNPAQLQSRIQELQSRNLISERGEADGVPQAPAQSSNIYGFKYDPKDGKLTVRFQEGGLYEFYGIPNYIYKIFEQGAVPAKTSGQNRFGRWWRGKSNPSYGAAFYELIRLGGYPYKKLK